MREHLCRARKGSHAGHIYTWLRAIDLIPEVDVLEEVSGGDTELADAERFWIASMKASGAVLVNHTDGGEGAVGYKHTDEARKKMSENGKGKRLGPRSERWKLDSDQVKRAVDLYKSGLGLDAVAAQVGNISGGGVRKILIREGVAMRTPNDHQWGKSRTDLLKLDPMGVQRIIEMYAGGMTAAAIAEAVGVISDTGVRNTLKRNGVALRSVGSRKGSKYRKNV